MINLSYISLLFSLSIPPSLSVCQLFYCLTFSVCVCLSSYLTICLCMFSLSLSPFLHSSTLSLSCLPSSYDVFVKYLLDPCRRIHVFTLVFLCKMSSHKCLAAKESISRLLNLSCYHLPLIFWENILFHLCNQYHWCYYLHYQNVINITKNTK